MNIDETVFLSTITALLVLLLLAVRRSGMDYRWKLMLAILLTFEGISISLLANKVPWYFGLLITIVAGGYLATLLQERPEGLTVHSIGSHLMERLTNDGRLTRWFPVIGLTIAVADIVANALVFDGRFGGYDWTVLAAAATWVGYGYIPPAYSHERDFAFLFINLLVMVLVVPLVGYNIITGGTDEGTTNLGEHGLVEILLTNPLKNILSLMGYEALSVGNTLHFRLENGNLVYVSIAQGCSGIYSVAVFVAAFVAFVATEYNRLDRNVAALLLLGILTAYFANLFRMAFIVIVGHYHGMEALEWAHANTGWLIFMFWVGIFWSVIFRFLVPLPTGVRSKRREPENGRI
ncbi:MAG TPA: exosortase/archaeosortase family protein [Flavobacteriales bacterium]|nr:exosortase/archaeosortase family protein [Flavobacteriales bacterium]